MTPCRTRLIRDCCYALSPSLSPTPLRTVLALFTHIMLRAGLCCEMCVSSCHSMASGQGTQHKSRIDTDLQGCEERHQLAVGVPVRRRSRCGVRPTDDGARFQCLGLHLKVDLGIAGSSREIRDRAMHQSY
jgi:hypothetical protein